MTVKVTAGEAPVQPVAVPASGTGPRVSEAPVRDIQLYTDHRVKRKRRARGSFGDVVFLQLILSVLFAGGVWSGLTFGDDKVREICLNIAAMFG